MALTESDYYRALGIEPPQEEGGNEREVAEPAAEEGIETEEPQAGSQSEDEGRDESTGEEAPEADSAEGGNEREVAEPAEVIGERAPQTKEERSRQAAARRQRETEAAIQEAIQREREQTNAELADLFKWAGFKNGSAPIESIEQFRAYKQQSDAMQLERDLKAGKLTPELLRQMVQSEVQAQTPAEPAGIPDARPPMETDQAFQAQVETELAEIRKYDPGIQTVEDFANLDRRDAFFNQVAGHGHSFLEAYQIVYADKIAAEGARRAAAAEAQRTMNNARSKDHMRPIGAKGTGDVAVPAETMRYYRAMMPDMSEEEIRRDYNKYQKNKRE